jgi:iron uptake system EfeUOB component EfeO/EfeM
MLDTTEANLKKLAGKQLTPNQQDMVSQTRQFMQQSKAAVDAGDLERARTLAWKAQVLSEELVKPKE